MVFSSTVFLFLFLPAVIAVYYNPFFKSRKFRNYFLLLTSLSFYGWGEPVFVFVMILSIIVNWAFSLLIDKQEDLHKRKLFLLPPILFDIALIFCFKYLAFAVNNFGLLLGNSSMKLEIALPIGISFFTFQIMSYVLDVYYKKAEVQKNVLNVGLYISMFPQLIAGPIVRYETVAHEINHRVETSRDFTAGMMRFVFGLGKKILLANYLGLIADNIFALSGYISAASAWLGIITYAMQIYFDFSGYSDMAIGLGKMFGFHFDENFNYPYIANSVTDFWRRWHISLSTWFRDYVYIPLGGNRAGKLRWVFNLFIVWLLTGIWHGANWTFIVWGLYYLVFLLIEKFTGFTKKIGVLSHLYTLLVVLLGWVIFRSESLAAAGRYIGVLFGVGATSGVDPLFWYYLSGGKWVILAGVLCSLPIAAYAKGKILAVGQADIRPGGSARALTIFAGIVKAVLLVSVFALSLLVCINSTYNPFIYFNF